MVAIGPFQGGLAGVDPPFQDNLGGGRHLQIVAQALRAAASTVDPEVVVHSLRAYFIRLVEEFDCLSGGAWLYLEVDPGFPWPNENTCFVMIVAPRGERGRR